MHEGLTKSAPTISLKLESLKSSSITELKQHWRALYNSEPPHRISRELLTRAVAYRIQEKVRGGLKPSTRRLLIRLASDARSGRPLRPEPAAGAPAGTASMRGWHGVTHEVRVLDWECCSSESAIARSPRSPTGSPERTGVGHSSSVCGAGESRRQSNGSK